MMRISLQTINLVIKYSYLKNYISSVMVCMVDSSVIDHGFESWSAGQLECGRPWVWALVSSNAVDHGFEPWSAKTKDYKIGTCCFYLKHAALRSKSKDWLERYEDNVSDWSDMSNHRLLFQWAIENPAKCVGTKWTSSHCNLFSPWYG